MRSMVYVLDRAFLRRIWIDGVHSGDVRHGDLRSLTGDAGLSAAMTLTCALRLFSRPSIRRGKIVKIDPVYGDNITPAKLDTGQGLKRFALNLRP